MKIRIGQCYQRSSLRNFVIFNLASKPVWHAHGKTMPRIRDVASVLIAELCAIVYRLLCINCFDQRDGGLEIKLTTYMLRCDESLVEPSTDTVSSGFLAGRGFTRWNVTSVKMTMAAWFYKLPSSSHPVSLDTAKTRPPDSQTLSPLPFHKILHFRLTIFDPGYLEISRHR